MSIFMRFFQALCGCFKLANEEDLVEERKGPARGRGREVNRRREGGGR